MTDQELKQLAIDVYDGKVWTDRQCNENNIDRVFFILTFMDRDDPLFDKMKSGEVVLLYEYLDKQNTMGDPSFPTFMSMQWLCKEEYVKFCGFHEQYKALKKEFIS